MKNLISFLKFILHENLFSLKIYDFKKIGKNEIEIIKELFTGVFTIEPWNDD